MKKVLIGISFVVILAVVAVLFVNAKNAPVEAKKVSTEMSEGCGGCPTATPACATKTEMKTAEAKECDPATCAGMASK